MVALIRYSVRFVHKVVEIAGSPTTNYTYDAANRLTAVDAQSISYNNAGQMTDDGTLTYSWDRGGRLLSAGSSSYAYNGVGNRLSQTVSAVVTEYLLDVQPGLSKVLAATTSGNTTRYVHDLRGLHSQQQSNGDWIFPITDGLNSVRSVLDEGFDVLHSQHYAPYGEPFGENGTSQTDFGFTGEPTDGNGLVHLRARYLNPSLGVFPSLDPVEGDLERIMSLNGYSYAEGRVTNWTDPTGNTPCDCEQVRCRGYEAYIGCLEHCTGQRCFRYDRQAAAQYAKDWALANCEGSDCGDRISPFAANPDYCYFPGACSRAEGHTDCANFVSQALRRGDFPMHYPGGRAALEALRSVNEASEGWACRIQNDIVLDNAYVSQCVGTINWKGAVELAAYLRAISPVIVQNREAQYNVAKLQIGPIQAAGIEAGDVVYTDESIPEYVAFIVGWGPRLFSWQEFLDDPNRTLTDRWNGGDQVPYIVDHGSQNQFGGFPDAGLPRPYYFLRMEINPHLPNSRLGGVDWTFIKVPQIRCIDPNDIVEY